MMTAMMVFYLITGAGGGMVPMVVEYETIQKCEAAGRKMKSDLSGFTTGNFVYSCTSK